jgi:hypothetical protein
MKSLYVLFIEAWGLRTYELKYLQGRKEKIDFLSSNPKVNYEMIQTSPKGREEFLTNVIISYYYVKDREMCRDLLYKVERDWYWNIRSFSPHLSLVLSRIFVTGIRVELLRDLLIFGLCFATTREFSRKIESTNFDLIMIEVRRIFVLRCFFKRISKKVIRERSKKRKRVLFEIACRPFQNSDSDSDVLIKFKSVRWEALANHWLPAK